MIVLKETAFINLAMSFWPHWIWFRRVKNIAANLKWKINDY
jgi:hypothetical protein